MFKDMFQTVSYIYFLFFSCQWDLVCDLRSFKQMGQTIYMGGVLVGAVIFGGLSDRYHFAFLIK